MLTQINKKQYHYQNFIQPLIKTLYQLINQTKHTPIQQFHNIITPNNNNNTNKKKTTPHKHNTKKNPPTNKIKNKTIT